MKCKLHDSAVEFVCEQLKCKRRFLCQNCFKDSHSLEHKYSIVKLKDFLQDQNRKRLEMLGSTEQFLLSLRGTMESFDSFIQQ